MMKQITALLISLVMVSVINVADAGEYHVSTNGNDNASGAGSAPWKSIAKANEAAMPGDVIIFHAGQYSGSISPARSGSEGSPITFRAAPEARVLISASTGVKLGASRHIVVDGFEIHASYQVVNLTGSSYITIRNCGLIGGRGNYAGFLLDNASYCVIQNNFYDRQDPQAMTGGGDGIKLVSGSHHNLVDGNTVTRCQHVAFASSYSKATVNQNHNIWRNNTAYNNHTNYSLQDGVQRCVFENNKGYYLGQIWTGGNGNCLQFTGTNCIIRFNTLYDDTASRYTSRKWVSIVGSGSGSANGGTPSIQYNKIYNNTIYGESDQGWAKAGWRIDNYGTGLYQRENRFKNNIFARATASQVDDIDATSTLSRMSNTYEGNLLCGANGNAARIRYEYSGGSVVWTLAEAKRNKAGQWSASNVEGDPLFVNTGGQGPAKDLKLRGGSPAIDAAVHLTTATIAGSGSLTVTVGDAGYFIDGWGIPGVEGDSIRIGGSEPVRVTEIDYAGNTLTLSSPRSWGAGARVYYYRSDRFQGNTPDIGAHEFGASRSIAVTTGAPTLTAPPDGGAQLSGLVYFSWKPVPYTLSYRLQISSDPTFAAPIVDARDITQSSYVASGLRRGSTLYWRVAAFSAFGNFIWSAYQRLRVDAMAEGEETPTASPRESGLRQNYPNPFNPSTLIRYSLAVTEHVSLKIFNVLGQEVASLVDANQSPGLHEALFDAQALPSGTYICLIQTPSFKEIKKMMLVR